jgi:hypothetical protein
MVIRYKNQEPVIMVMILRIKLTGWRGNFDGLRVYKSEISHDKKIWQNISVKSKIFLDKQFIYGKYKSEYKYNDK